MKRALRYLAVAVVSASAGWFAYGVRQAIADEEAHRR